MYCALGRILILSILAYQLHSTVWFLFFFNRLFAFLASYALRTYTWHKYHVHLEFQALQFSLLGGRLFFRNLRYQGSNETVLIHDGHLTWRYWLRRVQHVECGEGKSATRGDSPGINGQAVGSQSEEFGAHHVPRNLPCRISIEIRGIEWYVYNRSAAYETILKKIANEDVSQNPNSNDKGRTPSTSDLSFNKYASRGKNGEDRSLFKTRDEKSAAQYENGLARELREVDSISTKNTPSTSTNMLGYNETSKLPSLLNVLPISIECSKGAVVMGNRSTRSILVAKFDNATGHLGARNARSIDKYKQLIEFELGHPVIQLKKNQDYMESQISEGARHKRKDEITRVPSKSEHMYFAITQRIRNAWSSFRGVISFKILTDSWARDRAKVIDTSLPSEYNPGISGQSRWLGLTRYLDEDDDLAEQERWKAIEYGRFPTILDSPKLAISVYWDVPGLVMMPNNNLREPYPKASDDINGGVPPDWGVDIRIFGGNIRYGPWADRQRADLQAIFFPPLYKDAVPEKILVPGETRVSTVFKLVIEIEEQVMLGILTREESKDWKWKGRENGQDKSNTRRKGRKGHAKNKKNETADTTPESRPCGWLDMKLFADSTISFTMDLVAKSNGFTNRIELDLHELEISTSVNHGLLLRSMSQRILCDLSYPLKWNELHSWRIDIHAHSPEIFLLRDHLFLLTDLVSDWVSGPPSDFHTFVPFDYGINLQLSNFKVYLNANDRNIINNPADIEDNIFTMLYGKNLSAAISIPLRNFRSPRNQISFDVKANDGGMEVFSPLWNTYQTFLDDSRIARMENLRVYGAYDYFTSTRSGLTDILILNLDGSSLKLHLYGFFVRYLLNLKENYFGEHLHFRTVEEYQAQNANQEKYNNGVLETASHTRLSNDLDVIMAINVDEPRIMLPTHIYSARENISLDISSLGLDLRFTNYYMDLAVTLSPISISHSTTISHLHVSAEQQSYVQVFIDGLEISSHRLFGLPPAEPTYVCHYEFLVGSITGECSDDALKSLFHFLRSFTFGFKDSENALVCTQAQVTHDVTFLRARIKPIKVGLQIQEVAFVFSSDEIKVGYNDMIGQLFSERLSISAPRLTIACVTNASISPDARSSGSTVAPKVYVETTIDAQMVKQMQNSTLNRQLQQSHISQHDGRTHRTPWLIQSPEQSPLPTSLDRVSKYRAPAIPIPPMPVPVLEVLDCMSDYSTTSSRSLAKPTRRATSRRTNSFLSAYSAQKVRGKQSHPHIVSKTKPEKPTKGSHHCFSPSIIHDSAANWGRPELTTSNPYRRPQFFLLETRLDLSQVPRKQYDAPVDISRYDLGSLDVNKIPVLDQGLERSSYIVQLPKGIRVFCQSESIVDIGKLLLHRQKADPVTLLDALQVGVTGEQPAKVMQNGEQKVIELRLWIPHVETRMINARPFKGGLISQQLQIDFRLQRLLITGRSSETCSGDDASVTSSQSLHSSLDQVGFSISLNDGGSLVAQAVIQAVLYDTICWMTSGSTLAVNMQFKDLDVITTAPDTNAMPTLLQQTFELSHVANESLLKIKEIKTPSLQSLVLYLSMHGDKIPDPPFLTTASYVLRSATSHPRTFDSWKMMSRLRFIYQSLTDSLKHQVTLQCMQENSMCPQDASTRVLRSFEKRRTWDMIHVRQCRLMREVYGSSKNTVDKPTTTQLPLKVVLTVGKSRFCMDPQVGANEIIFEQFIFGMKTYQFWQESPNSGALIHMRQSVLEMHCGLATLQFNTSITQYLEVVLETFKALPLENSAGRNAIPSSDTLQIVHRLHIIFSLTTVNFRLRTINLEAHSVLNGLNASIFLYPSLDGKTFSNNAIINSGTAVTRLYDKSAPVFFIMLARSSLFGSIDGHFNEAESGVLKIAISCADLSLQVLEKPLEILDIADRLIREEIAVYCNLMRIFESVPDRRQQSVAAPMRHGNLKIYVSLLMGSYSINLAILPSLTYLISGQGLQTLLLPAKGVSPGMAIEFDIKDHSHIMRKHFKGPPDNISSLPIPPIYGRFALHQDSNQNSGEFHATVGEVNLDASSVHAFLNAGSHREIASLSTKFTREISLLQKRWQEQVGTAPQHSRTTQLEQQTIYAVHVSLLGLVIGTSILKSANLAEGAQLRLDMGRVQLNATNKGLKLEQVLKSPNVDVTFSGIKIDLIQFKHSNSVPSGGLGLGLTLKSTSVMNARNELIRTYQILSHDLNIHIHSQTASILLEIISHLQDTLKAIDVAKEVRGLRRLTLARIRSDAFAPMSDNVDEHNEEDTTSLANSSAMYSLKMIQSKIVWKTGASTPGREAEDLVWSLTKIDLASKNGKTARLLIEEFQLRMVPTSGISTSRAANSALLPELVFNVAYLSTKTDRRLAFQAAGKSLDLYLTSEFILPANELRRSMAIAVADIRKAIISWNASTTEGRSPRKPPLGNKRLTSLLIDADFAGAIVHVQGRRTSGHSSLARDHLRGGSIPQHGRYGQFTSDNASSNTTLRAPGIALRFEYKDLGDNEPSLSAEFKVDASSNILYPTVVPLIMEISSSIKEVVGDSDDQAELGETKPVSAKSVDDKEPSIESPNTILGHCRLNLGLRICRQEFSLSCQPIARVAATAQFEAIYITLSTMHSADQEQAFTLSAMINRLQMSVQHDYSRESTGSFEVDSIFLSMMSSKHAGVANGLSAILKSSPVKALINAKQLHDFLLFRDIWVPRKIRHHVSTTTKPASESQAFMVQHYQQVAAAGIFPWDATVSIAKLDIQLHLGQSLGRSAFVISDVWISSKKTSDWEQNLCLGFQKAQMDATGRMSGFIELQNFKVRTSIHWTVMAQKQSRAPLIQASLGFDRLRVKAAWDFEAFLIADITSSKFLMYNIRDGPQGLGDHLVGILEGGKVQVFCTSTSASQALALYQAFERLIQEKRGAYETSLKDIENFICRKPLNNPSATWTEPKKEEGTETEGIATAPLQLQTNVFVALEAISLGAFASTFFDNQIFKLEALAASARFGAFSENDKLRSRLGLTLGQLRVALSGVSRTTGPKKVGEISVEEIVASATESRGGTILKVPRLEATMQTWQAPLSNHIDYIFGSSFQGKVDVGWNYSRISFLRGMWTAHTRALAQRWGKPLPPSALQITGGLQPEGDYGENSSKGSGPAKITAVVNVPQSKFQYTALEPPVIHTPQLRDMGEATPPLEWIGLQRERLPTLTHQIVIVSLLEVAKEVEDAYQRILGSF